LLHQQIGYDEKAKNWKEETPALMRINSVLENITDSTTLNIETIVKELDDEKTRNTEECTAGQNDCRGRYD
jgi:hypothetical protein